MSDSEAALTDASAQAGAEPQADSEVVVAADSEPAEPGSHAADAGFDSIGDDSTPGEPKTGASVGEVGESAGSDQPEPAEAEAAATAAERDQYLQDLQRVTAEFANFRRQAAKRASEVSAQACARLAEALLVVFDACEAAARQGVEGVDEIAAQLTTVLTREGLQVICDDGKAFDPARHEATLTEPADADSEDQGGPVVAETLRTGYAWNGRVLRAAMVRVKG